MSAFSEDDEWEDIETSEEYDEKEDEYKKDNKNVSEAIDMNVRNNGSNCNKRGEILEEFRKNDKEELEAISEEEEEEEESIEGSKLKFEDEMSEDIYQEVSAKDSKEGSEEEYEDWSRNESEDDFEELSEEEMAEEISEVESKGEWEKDTEYESEEGSKDEIDEMTEGYSEMESENNYDEDYEEESEQESEAEYEESEEYEDEFEDESVEEVLKDDEENITMVKQQVENEDGENVKPRLSKVEVGVASNGKIKREKHKYKIKEKITGKNEKIIITVEIGKAGTATKIEGPKMEKKHKRIKEKDSGRSLHSLSHFAFFR